MILRKRCMLVIQIPPELKQRIKKRAATVRRSMSNWIVLALEAQLNQAREGGEADVK